MWVGWVADVINCAIFLKIGSRLPELEDLEIAFPIETVYRPYNSVSTTVLCTVMYLQLRRNQAINVSHSAQWAIQESPAIADKPARRESMPKIAPIRRAYNVVADNTGLSSFV